MSESVALQVIFKNHQPAASADPPVKKRLESVRASEFPVTRMEQRLRKADENRARLLLEKVQSLNSKDVERAHRLNQHRERHSANEGLLAQEVQYRANRASSNREENLSEIRKQLTQRHSRLDRARKRLDLVIEVRSNQLHGHLTKKGRRFERNRQRGLEEIAEKASHQSKRVGDVRGRVREQQQSLQSKIEEKQERARLNREMRRKKKGDE